MAKNPSVFSGISWAVIERIVLTITSMVISLTLARLLTPEDYGIMAIVQIFIALANVFVVNGVSISLVRDSKATEEDYSTVFYLNLMIGCILWGILRLSIPYIVIYFKDESLSPYIQALSYELPIASVYAVLYAIVTKRMEFRKLFFSTVGASLLSGVIGIILAFWGYGIWALIWQELLRQIFSTAILGVLVSWYPKMLFSKEKIVWHFSYGMKITLATLLSDLAAQLRTILIGRLYTKADLAFYHQGQKYPESVALIFTAALNAVMFPAISNLADDKKAISKMILKAVQISSFFTVPMLVGFAAVSETLVRVFLTDKWLSCVPYMQIACFSLLPVSINTINFQAVKAIGQGSTYLYMQILKIGINIAMFLLFLPRGVFAVAAGSLLCVIPGCIINTYPSHRYWGCGFWVQFKIMLPSVFCSMVMAMIVWAIKLFYHGNLLVLLVIQVLCGIVIYVGLAVIFQSESLWYLIGKIRSLLYKGHF